MRQRNQPELRVVGPNAHRRRRCARSRAARWRLGRAASPCGRPVEPDVSFSTRRAAADVGLRRGIRRARRARRPPGSAAVRQRPRDRGARLGVGRGDDQRRRAEARRPAPALRASACRGRPASARRRGRGRRAAARRSRLRLPATETTADRARCPRRAERAGGRCVSSQSVGRRQRPAFRARVQHEAVGRVVRDPVEALDELAHRSTDAGWRARRRRATVRALTCGWRRQLVAVVTTARGDRRGRTADRSSASSRSPSARAW